MVMKWNFLFHEVSYISQKYNEKGNAFYFLHECAVLWYEHIKIEWRNVQSLKNIGLYNLNSRSSKALK